jgi:serine protease
MSFRLIVLTVAASAWLFSVGGSGTGLSAQSRGTSGARGPAAGTASARNDNPGQQSSEDASPFLMTAERAAAFARARRDQLNWVPGEVLVKFKPGVSLARGARALSALRGPVNSRAGRWIGDVLLVPTPGEDNPDRAAGILAQQPEVLWAQPNFIHRLHATPTDPGYGSQWHLDQINMPGAWDINPGGQSDVLVAVVDSGVTEVTRTSVFQLWTGSRFEFVPIPYAINPDIAESRFVQGRDFVLYSAGTPVLDMAGHGTHVAGTILQSTNNGTGFAGIAYNARLLPVKVCRADWDWQIIISSRGIPGFWEQGGECPVDAILDGIRYAADQGAKVINLSLGGPGESPAELEALRYAVGKGAFVAIAAGNNYTEGNEAESPAKYGRQVEGVMAVGAVGLSMKRAYYSNTSSGTEIAAPGGDSRDGGTAGKVYQYGINEADYDFESVVKPRFDRYTTVSMQGTSMAAPHVAGVAALLYSQGVTNPAAIEAAIKKFAKDLGAAGVDNEYGAGLVDARATLRGLGVAR